MHIIDFNEKKRKKEHSVEKGRQQKLLLQFQQTGKVDYLHKLVETKQLNHEKHQLFLAFMYAVESEGVKLESVCKDALTMNEQLFHSKYSFDWWMSVQCALTFLAIQKESRQEAYDTFIDLVFK